MIKVVAKSRVQAGKTEEFLAAAKKLEAATNSLEKECVSYELFADKNDPLAFVFIETWPSEEALQRHMQAPHYREAGRQFAQCREKPSEITLYTKVV